MATVKSVPLGPCLRSMTGVEVIPISGLIWGTVVIVAGCLSVAQN